jgi:SAM-dependent methyltransferase
VERSFADGAEWISSGVFAARIEQTALLQLLLDKKTITWEEYLNKLQELLSDEFMYSVREFVSQSEKVLRDGPWHIGGEAATEQLGRKIRLAVTDRVLDVGCGVGGATRQLADTFGCDCIGIDIRQDRIVEALLRTSALGLDERVTFQVAEGERLPFEDESFDVVVSQATWDHVPDKGGLIREAYRVLRDGGRLGVEFEALTEKADLSDSDRTGSPMRLTDWQRELETAGFGGLQCEEMWEETRAFYPYGPDRLQVDRNERVNVRILAFKG